MKRFLTILAITLPALVSAFGSTPQALAASVNYNNLIDNQVFDAQTMTASQVDAFLNSFSNSCISSDSGFRAPAPTGYNPSQGFTYGSNVTAGKIIYDAAHVYGLNPQVLLATLQKEQSLVTGSAGCHPNTPSPSATVRTSTSCTTGTATTTLCTNACPYSGGCVNIAVGYGCPYYCYASKVGFSKQIIHAAWFLSFVRHRAEGQVNWKGAVVNSGWDNSDDLSTNYTGPMARGTHQRCSSCTAKYYSGANTLGDGSVTILNGATAALYYYTPFKSGNTNFINIFTSWFGSVYAGCTYPTDQSGAVYRLVHPRDNSYFLTSSPNEVCTATRAMGYKYEGYLFFPENTGASAVYRLVKKGHYLFTTSANERDNAINKYGFTLEGTAFQASNSYDASKAPLAVYRMNYSGTGGYFYTVSTSEINEAEKVGFNLEGVAFYTNNTTGKAYPNNIFRLSHPRSGYLYTASSAEKASAIDRYGFQDEGVGFQTRVGFTSDDLPVYRLTSGKGYLFTTSMTEQRKAIRLGYRYEGISFFAYPTTNLGASKQVFRLSNPSGAYLYTTSVDERDYATSKYHYHYEGTGFRIP